MQAGKTKRQLRAEAAERLKKVHYHSPMNMLGAILDRTGIGREEDTLDLIDLLTDEELPEGDAVSIMREVAIGRSDDGKRIETENGTVIECARKLVVDGGAYEYALGGDAEVLLALADMVERDYVRREALSCPDCAKELERVTADLDFYKRLYEQQAKRTLDAENHRGEEINELVKMTIERDEWKAKAYGHRTRLDRLYETDAWFRDQLEANYGLTEGYLMAPYDYSENPAVTGDGANDALPPIADVTEPADCVDDANVGANSENLGISRDSEMDARERLEADVRGELRNLAAMVTNGGMPVHGAVRVNDAVDETMRRLLALLDRQAAITEREHAAHCVWVGDPYYCAMTGDGVRRRLAKLQAEVGELRKALEHDKRMRAGGLPDGIAWPRFESGELVGIGDKMMYDERPERVQGIRFYDTAIVFEFTGVNHCRTTYGFAYGQPVDMAPLLASDGEPIEVGQTLYGLSDGKAWEVDGFDRKRPWSVWAHYGEHRKCLKPEWLTHERPDSLESIAETVRGWRMFDPDAPAVMVHAHALDDLARRIGEMAKEGAHGERGDD